MRKLNDTQAVFTPNAGTVLVANCGVCGREMDVTRGVLGPTNSVEGMSGRKHYHDLFQCPDVEEKWHIQIVLLRREKERTASNFLADLLRREIDLIFKTKTPTKELTVHNMCK
jgi:hypothetical protein